MIAEEMRCAARIQIRQLPGPCFGLSHMVLGCFLPSNDTGCAGGWSPTVVGFI